MFAALPMYDWPDAAAETDATWNRIRNAILAEGVDAPPDLTRRNGDMPAVPGGIRDATGNLIAPDPATLPCNEFEMVAVWHHPQLLLGQACWGPLEQGLSNHVLVVGQPDYSPFEGGQGVLYSSAILMRKGEGQAVAAPDGPQAKIPIERLRGRRLAFNSRDSMSGLIALKRDLEATGQSIGLFAAMIETGGHRGSLRAVARGEADVCACDCRSWALMQQLEPEVAASLVVVGWTAKRKGLPFIMAPALQRYESVVRNALQAATP